MRTSVSDHNRACQTAVTRACAHRDSVRATRDLPALGDHVPDGEIVARQREADSRRLARCEVDAVKAAELVRRRLGRRRRGDVHLGKMSACSMYREEENIRPEGFRVQPQFHCSAG
jgi:hypothetical protein